MKRLYNLNTNGLFALHILLLFLLIFERDISLPPLVQTFGRMHPLLLHLPIGFLVLLGILPLIKKEIDENAYFKVQEFLLHLCSLLAVLTVLFGLFLGQEGGYGETLGRHKWTGVIVGWLTYGLLLLHVHRPQWKKIFTMLLLLEEVPRV